MPDLTNNTEADRTRRRLAATRQALADGVNGVVHFEIRTPDREARTRCAASVLVHITEMAALAEKLLEARRP